MNDVSARLSLEHVDLAADSKCFVPSSLARSTVILPSGVLMLKFWMVENNVHFGDPMIMYGLHSRISANALWRHSCLLKSQM